MPPNLRRVALRPVASPQAGCRAGGAWGTCSRPRPAALRVNQRKRRALGEALDGRKVVSLLRGDKPGERAVWWVVPGLGGSLGSTPSHPRFI